MTAKAPAYDPWDPVHSLRDGVHRLTCVELTVTTRCNLRCTHCAVGEMLAPADPEPLPLDLLLRRLDEVEALTALNLTGGELSLDARLLDQTVLPLLQYARRRGLATQINTNLTMEVGRYLALAPYVDVFHITWNYRDAQDFHRTAWGHGARPVRPEVSERLYDRMVINIRTLAAARAYLSAESMINPETAPHLGRFSYMLLDMGCRRYELNPMYPVDWAAGLPVLSLDDYRTAVDRFLDERAPGIDVLFGTFPFFACSPDPAHRALLRKARRTPGVTVRNCPDGRSRLNLNIFTGDVFVTDFTDGAPLGNISGEALEPMHRRWLAGNASAPYLCHCPEAGCTGPNPLVAAMYHAGVDFRSRHAIGED